MDVPFESQYQADQRAAAEAQQQTQVDPAERQAHALFGSTQPAKPSPQRDASLLGNPEQALAERLYGNPDAARANSQAERIDPNDDHAVAGALYDAQAQYAQSLPDRLVDDWAVLDPEQREAVLEEIADYRQLAGELQVGNAQVEELVGLEDQFAQVTEAQAEEWRAESANSLIREFGGAKASELLADARALVAQNPRLWAYLDEAGRGDHPKVVRMVIELAQRERAAGRLKGGR